MTLPWVRLGAGVAVVGLIVAGLAKMAHDQREVGAQRERLRVLTADVARYQADSAGFQASVDSLDALQGAQATELARRDTALGYARIAAHRAAQAADGAIARARAAVADSVRTDLETIIAAGDTARQEATACGLALDTCREARVTALAELGIVRARLDRADSLLARQDSALAKLRPAWGRKLRLGCAIGPALAWGMDGNVRPGLAITCGVAY